MARSGNKSRASEKEALLSLFRYFVWSTNLRALYMQRTESLRVEYLANQIKGHRLTDEEIWAGDAGMFLAHWFGALYTVVEGWQKLKLSDSNIEDMISSEHTYLLKMFRHGAYHFTDAYWDKKKFLQLLGNMDAVVWAHQLDREFSQYFARLYRGDRGKSRLLSQMLADRKGPSYFGLTRLLSCLGLCSVLALNTLYRQNIYVSTVCLLLLVMQMAPSAIPYLQKIIVSYRVSSRWRQRTWKPEDQRARMKLNSRYRRGSNGSTPRSRIP